MFKLIELLAHIALKLTEISFRVLGELLKGLFAVGGAVIKAVSERKEERAIPAPSKRRKRR